MLDVASISLSGTEHPYEDRVLVDKKLGLFAIADGVTHSTHGSGAVAAELALRLLHDYITADVTEVIMMVHQTMIRERENDRTLGETTLTVASVRDDCLKVGNIGDSPAYLVHGGMMRSMFTADTNSMGYITQVIGHPENIRVHTREAKLRKRDMVIIASDGVGHVLNPSLVIPLTNLSSELAKERVIQEARRVTTGYDDDKSLIVLRVLG